MSCLACFNVKNFCHVLMSRIFVMFSMFQCQACFNVKHVSVSRIFDMFGMFQCQEFLACFNVKHFWHVPMSRIFDMFGMFQCQACLAFIKNLDCWTNYTWMPLKHSYNLLSLVHYCINFYTLKFMFFSEEQIKNKTCFPLNLLLL